jgi:hypothetical protein
MRISTLNITFESELRLAVIHVELGNCSGANLSRNHLTVRFASQCFRKLGQALTSDLSFSSQGLWLPLIHHDMTSTSLDHDELIKALTDNFNILADEVQLLSDRKTILEHKLRFAHEQVGKERLPFCCTTFTYIMMKNFSSRSGAATAATTDKHHVS